MKTAYDALRASRLAPELTDQQLDTLAASVAIRDLADGEVLVPEGTSDDHLYGLMSGALDVVRAPMQIAGVECARNPTPERGQHTDEVLAEFGFTADEIAALHAAKAV